MVFFWVVGPRARNTFRSPTSELYWAGEAQINMDDTRFVPSLGARSANIATEAYLKDNVTY